MELLLLLLKLYLIAKVVDGNPRLETPKSNVDEDLVSSYSFYEPEGQGTYAFGYEVDDFESSNVQFRDEERHNDGKVEGSYGFITPDGQVYMVRYIADTGGYRAIVQGPMTKLDHKGMKYTYNN